MMKEYLPLPNPSSQDTIASIDDDDVDDMTTTNAEIDVSSFMEKYEQLDKDDEYYVVKDQQAQEELWRKRRRYRRFALLTFCLSIFLVSFSRKTPPQPLATCGDCYCIVDPEKDATCPTEKPPSEFSSHLIETFASQVAVNPYLLDCNPYDAEHSNCQTTPPQETFSEDESDADAVCGIHYDFPMVDTRTNSSLCESNQYHLKSYVNMTQAVKAGAYVTHGGKCGVCSTTQDLAAYLRIPDLTSEGIACGKAALLGFHHGVQCYMDLGFTKECSHMWIYNNYNTWKHCAWTCASQAVQHIPFNTPAPTCALNECLQCDEDHSGPIFQRVAGRTRRNSGLRSAIARPCDSITLLTHESCPITRSLWN